MSVKLLIELNLVFLSLTRGCTGSHQYIKTVFSETIGPIELKFHMKTPYNKLAKIYANCIGHMAKMADMSIYGKNPLKIFLFRTRRLMTLGLGM